MQNNRPTIPVLCWCFLLWTSTSHAQPQIWGYTIGNQEQAPGSPYPLGSLFRTDINGMNPEFVQILDSNTYRWPKGNMVLAANGKLYATTQSRGSWNPEPLANIWEYDPVLDTIQIVHRFEHTLSTGTVKEVQSGLTEGAPGVLYGFGNSPSNMAPEGVSQPIYSFHTATNSAQVESAIPGYYFQSFGQWHSKYLNSEITVLPDGRLMVAEARSRVLSGAIGIADTITDGYTQPYTFDQFNAPDGYDPNGDWVEVDGVYYSTTQRGGFAFEDIDLFLENGYGVIYSYNVATNTYTKHHEFTDPLTGFKPFYGMVRGVDGLLYGLAWGGTRANGGVYYPGTIYSFDPETSEFQHLIDLGLTALGFAVVGGGTGCQLLPSSNGRIYGSFWKGLFEYDPVADTVRYATGLNVGFGRQGASQLLELCRKPNYKPRPTSSYTVCTGSYFAYDLRNVNATTVVWRRNNVVVPGQTDQRLEFAAISVADAGVWSCTLTDECGVTEPPPITIAVNAGSGIAPVASGPQVLCGPDGNVVLTGNTNGGAWSGGATSPTLTVTEPGLYQIHQPNACGSTYSNIVLVARQPIPVAPEVGDAYGFVWPSDSVLICTENPAIFFGNGPGLWHDVTVGTWHTPLGDPDNGSTAPSVSAELEGDYYITYTNACGSDTSSHIRSIFIEPWPIANISYSDIFGQPADNLICAGDSVLVTVNFPEPIYTLFSEELGILLNLGSVWISDTTRYYILAQGPCAGLASDTLRFQLQVDEFVPPPAVILPDDVSPLLGCDQDSTFLTSQYPHAIWSWIDADGTPQQDTTEQLLVDWTIGGNGFYALINYNGCGDGPGDGIQVIGTPAPDVLYTELLDTICLSDGAQTLSVGTPAGGTYSGTGVSGNTFDPMVVGVGEHTITYSYSDGNCTGFAQDVVVVDVCAGIGQIPSDIGQWIRISPNPTAGLIELTVDGNFRVGAASLFSADGRRLQLPHALRPGKNVFDLRDLADGLYRLMIDLDNERRSLSVVVAH